MKKLINTLILASIVLPAASQAQEELQDLWFVAPGNSSAPDAFPQAKFLSPLFTAREGGERVCISDLKGDLAKYRIIFDNTYTNNGGNITVLWGGNGTTVPGSENYTIGALTIKNYSKASVSKFYTEKKGHYKNTSITINGDLVIENNNPLSTFRIGEDFKSINVNGNVLIKDARLNLGSYDGAATTAKSHIKGDIDLSGKKCVLFTSVGGNIQIGTFENPDLKVDGKIKMNSANNKWLYNSTKKMKLLSFISVGGIEGTGKIISDAVVGSDDKYNSRTVIALTNPAGSVSEYKGNISSAPEGFAGPDNKKRLDIEMRGEGTQILRIIKDQKAFMNGNITVYNGTLLLCNTNDLRESKDGETYNGLTMNGGKFGATGASATDATKKFANFNEITWNGGIITVELIDIDVNTYSVINAKSLSLGQGEEFAFEFFNKNDEDLSKASIKIKDFFNIAQDISAEQIAKLSGKTTDGKWKAVFNADTKTVSFEKN